MRGEEVSTGGAVAGVATAGRGDDLLRCLLAGTGDDPLPHVDRLPPRRAARSAGRPGRRAEVVAAFGRVGVRAPWAHQAEAAELAHAGRDVVVATGTASGKSLAYQLPVADRAARRRPRARALYLVADQGAGRRPAARAGRARPARRCGAATYDGDTPLDERDWVRAHAQLGPHQPGHAAPRDPAAARALGARSCVGCATSWSTSATPTAGSSARTWRWCCGGCGGCARAYGATPMFVLASATVADPAELGARG